MKDLIKALFLFHFRGFDRNIGLEKQNIEVCLLNWKVGDANTYRERKEYCVIMLIITKKPSLLHWCVSTDAQNLKGIILYHAGSMCLVFWRQVAFAAHN